MTNKHIKRYSSLGKGKVKPQFQIPLYCVLCLFPQSCSTLCNTMDCSPPGSSVHGNSPGKNTAVGCHALLQGDLPNPGIKPRSPALQADSFPAVPPGRYCYVPIKMDRIKKTIPKGLWGSGVTGTLWHGQWECKMVQPLQKAQLVNFVVYKLYLSEDD